MCFSLFIAIWDNSRVIVEYHDTRVLYVMYGLFQCKTNGYYFQNIDVEMRLVFCPATMKEQSHRFQMSTQSIMAGIRKMECIGIWRIDGCFLNEAFGIYPPLQMKKSKRKVQGVPQSQTAALPRPQEEEETDKSKQAQTKQTYGKH